MIYRVSIFFKSQARLIYLENTNRDLSTNGLAAVGFWCADERTKRIYF